MLCLNPSLQNSDLAFCSKFLHEQRYYSLKPSSTTGEGQESSQARCMEHCRSCVDAIMTSLQPSSLPSSQTESPRRRSGFCRKFWDKVINQCRCTQNNGRSLSPSPVDVLPSGRDTVPVQMLQVGVILTFDTTSKIYHPARATQSRSCE